MSVAGMPDLAPVQGTPASVEAWKRAWEQYLHYRGDPVAVASEAGEDDGSFVMGPVFAAVYRMLAASPLDAAPLRADVGRALERAASVDDREQTHVRALALLVSGDFTAAAITWDAMVSEGRDFAAVRFAHDVYLHVGDDEGRLASSSSAVEAWRDEPGFGFIAGQHAFALEETGHYEEAERLGREALSLDPDDLWARHALAHVYESTDDTPAARDLLEGSVARWSEQDLLANHIWWHLALRLLASGDAAGALAIFDEREPEATTAFQLCDQTSLLRRLELTGCGVGDRWDALADRWDALADRWDGVVERHTYALLDIHAGLTFARRPDHPGATRWFEGLRERETCGSENDDTFRNVVEPVVEAFRRDADGGYDDCVRLVDELGTSTSRIGGSIAQRHLITLIRDSAERRHHAGSEGGGADVDVSDSVDGAGVGEAVSVDGAAVGVGVPVEDADSGGAGAPA